MCFTIPACPARPKIYLVKLTLYLKFGLLFIIGGLFVFSLNAQTEGTKVKIPTIDMRGRPPMDATYAALKNSENDMVIVLIRGGSQDLIDETTQKMKALYHKGYTRIGIILCDLKPGEIGPVLGVVVDSMPYAVIKKAKPDDLTIWKIFNLTQDAYREFILPKIEQLSRDN